VLFLCLAMNEPAPPPAPLLPWRRPHQVKVDPEFMRVLQEVDTEQKALFLDELGRIMPVHLPPWVAELRRSCREDSASLLEQFSLELLGRMGAEGMPMLHVSTEIGKLLSTIRNPAP
jgi:hypothetical protein